MLNWREGIFRRLAYGGHHQCGVEVVSKRKHATLKARGTESSDGNTGCTTIRYKKSTSMR